MVRSLLNNQPTQFGCLIETKVKENKIDKIVSEVFHGCGFMSNYAFNNLGRFWVV